MKKKTARIILGILALAILAMICAALTGCQSMARYWGGSTTVELPEGMKLLEVTWKDDSLWYLVRPMREGETAEELRFLESSEWGIFNGEVILKEQEARP